MTHDERISSYIDNELTGEQEQEFLISLAASDGLRKSFRSELVLKNVLHRDEMTTNPPRKMRGAIFGAIGLAGAGLAADGATATKANAAQSHGLFKAMFATKVNTLVTAAVISASGLAGYGVRTMVAPAEPAPIVRAVNPATIPNQVIPQVQTSGVEQGASVSQENAASAIHHQRAATVSHRTSARVNAAGHSNADTEPVSSAVGAGSIKQEPAEVNRK